MVALTDASGTTVATYSYDTFGTPTSWETFSTGWHNPFLYDGHDRARYDSETGLYWLSVRAYDPTLGRFLSRDPLGRVPLFFDASQPYAYGGNNPLTNVDPSGQFFSRQMFDGGDWMSHPVAKPVTRRVQTTHHVYHDHQNRYHISHPAGTPRPTADQIGHARVDAESGEGYFESQMGWFWTKPAMVWTGANGITAGWLLKWIKTVFTQVTKATALRALGAYSLAILLLYGVQVAIFHWQAWSTSDDYWRNPANIRGTLGAMQFWGALLSTLLLANSLILSVAFPELAWVFGGIAAVAGYALFDILIHDRFFIRLEEGELGYPKV